MNPNGFMPNMDCRTCWSQLPKFFMYYAIFTTVVSIGLIIACLAASSSFNCYIQNYLSLTSNLIYQSGEVWRIITCHLVNNNFWALIYIDMTLFYALYDFEKQITTKKLILLLLVSCVIVSLITSICAAILGLIPGINTVQYFYNQWYYDYSPIGSTAIVLMCQIFNIRALNKKTLGCCCFQMPAWLYMLISFIMAQLMMYPPWYGEFYNGAAILVGYCMPMRFLKLPGNGIIGQGFYQMNNNAAEQGQNGANAGAKTKGDTFGAKGRKL